MSNKKSGTGLVLSGTEGKFMFSLLQHEFFKNVQKNRKEFHVPGPGRLADHQG
jgi:hypothetical protein